MARRLTTEEFIKKARTLQGGRYGYESTVYVSTHKKITITCPTHGDFGQTPNNHLKGIGCPKCAVLAKASERTLTSEEFIKKANIVHGGKYLYAKSIYAGSQKKITITCLKHGNFDQRPDSHLWGRGVS